MYFSFKRETQIRGIPLTPLSTLDALESGQYCSGDFVLGHWAWKSREDERTLRLRRCCAFDRTVVAREEVAELHANTRAQEAVEQYRKHEQCEGHVQAITFDGESYDGKGYAGDRGGNEEEQSKLD